MNKTMTQESHEQELNEALNEPDKEDILQDFLAKRKLQISVLKKLLEQIPVPEDEADQEPTQEEKP